MNTLGERIKSIRKKNHLNQKDFAERLFVSASYISKVEKNAEIPTNMFLKLLSFEFNESFEWIISGNLEGYIAFSNDGAVSYYNEMNKHMDAIVKKVNEKDRIYLTQSYGYIVGLLCAIDLEKEYTNDYYKAIFNFSDLIEKLQFYTRTRGKSMRKDYQLLLEYKYRVDEDIIKITNEIKNMLRVYIKQNNIDIQI